MARWRRRAEGPRGGVAFHPAQSRRHVRARELYGTDDILERLPALLFEDRESATLVETSTGGRTNTRLRFNVGDFVGDLSKIYGLPNDKTTRSKCGLTLATVTRNG